MLILEDLKFRYELSKMKPCYGEWECDEGICPFMCIAMTDNVPPDVLNHMDDWVYNNYGHYGLGFIDGWDGNNFRPGYDSTLYYEQYKNGYDDGKMFNKALNPINARINI